MLIRESWAFPAKFDGINPITGPYVVAAHHYKICFQKEASPTSLANRVKHLSMALALSIPLINIIVFVAIRHLRISNAIKLPQEKGFEDLQKTADKIAELLNKKRHTHIFENHGLHDEVRKFSKAIKNDEKGTQQWIETLKKVEKLNIKCPTGKKVPLRFEREIRWLQNKGVSDQAQIEEVKGPLSEAEWKRIILIETEAFETPYQLNCIQSYTNTPNRFMLLTRDNITKEIIGFILCRVTESNELNIDTICRDADASGMSVGSSLYRGVGKKLESMPKKPTEVTLQVRPSNKTAFSLYEHVGFKFVEKTLAWKYENPTETPRSMSCSVEDLIKYSKTQNG